MNSRQKGKRGELEAAKELTRLGLGPARRGQQFNGLDGRDVVCEALDATCHFESKRTEQLSLYTAIEQAVRDAGDRIPVLMHRRSRKPWLFIVQSEHLVDFARCVITAHELNQKGTPCKE